MKNLYTFFIWENNVYKQREININTFKNPAGIKINMVSDPLGGKQYR
jgi:hypothetical protein